MEPEGSLPHSQMHATCPYPEPHSTRPDNDFNFQLCIQL